MNIKRVVVTGMGAITPLGNNVSDFWNNLKNGVSGASLITSFDTTLFKTKFACQVQNFDSELYIGKKDIRKFDLYCQYAIASTVEAIADGKIDLQQIDPNQVGVIWGTGLGGIITMQKGMEDYMAAGRVPRFMPFFIPKLISNIVAGQISIRNGFCGPSYVIASACSSSTHAMIDAYNYIRLGRSKIFVVGGSDAAITECGIGGFNVMHALSTNNDEYQTASRPFDATRDGFVMGDGGVALIFEEYEHAIKRGAKIYAEVVGGGMSSDAHHITAPHPEGDGAVLAMRSALEDSVLKLDDIDYINVHGTSTSLGDIAELKAIQRLFGDAAYKMNISSTKSMTGHMLGAAGAAEAVACVKAITDEIVPPTINNRQLDENIDSKLNLTLNQAQTRKIRYALSNTFGFGGHNGTIIFKKFEE